MAAPFEYVEANASTEEISKKINKEQPAVLVKDMIGSTHIITQYDIINAIK
ncbi:MAG: putative transcriptional regulator [Salibacteraceae bacterium]|jgi:predicted transcriptional regulator